MKHKQIEQKALIVTIIINAIIAASGIWVYTLTDLQVMFLDGFFSLIALLSTVSAIIISKVSAKKTPHYPHGLYFLEPLYAVLKSLLTVCLMIIALVSVSETAYAYFVHGKGEVMNTTPLLPYAIAMAVLCFGLSFYNRRQNKKINNTSTILNAESKTNFIDGLQSAGIGLAIILLQIIPVTSPLGFLYYTGDFFITAILVLFSIKEPVKVLFSAFYELTGGVTKDADIHETICNLVKKHFADIPQYEIYKTGMKIKLCIHPNKADYNYLTEVKESMLADLMPLYGHIEIVYLNG